MSKSIPTLIVVCLLGTLTYAYSGGHGTAEDPYQIATAQDLIDLGNEPNDYDKHFIMTGDIDLAEYVFEQAVIAPRAVSSGRGRVIFSGESFSGSFHGQGHVIHSLHIEGDGPLGLFGYTDANAAIVSVGLENVDVNSTRGTVGSLVAVNEGMIVSSHSTATVRGSGIVGGLVGFNLGTINSSHSAGTVRGGDGLVGRNEGTITACYSTATVSGGIGVGGLVGRNDGTITSSYASGSVVGAKIVGGLVGWNEGTITSSYASGSVYGDKMVGGLVGSNDSPITSSYSSGSVHGLREVGGLVGSNGGPVISSYSTGTVRGFENIGGLVGYNWGSITSSYSSGSVNGLVDSIKEVGGLVGHHVVEFDGTITSSFWDTETSGQSTSAGGTGLSTARMQEITTFLDAGWDFVNETAHGTSDFWIMPEGNYPRLAVFSGDPPAEPLGSGTLNDPYIITDANDLGTVWRRPEAYYRLESDIDLAGMIWLMPVVPAFGGGFDGNGHVIHHLQIHGGDFLGLFGTCSSRGTISHLGLEAVDVNSTGSYVGSLMAVNNGTITSSYSTGAVTGLDYVGGLVGRNPGTISISYSRVAVTGYRYVGGLLGFNEQLGGVTSSYSAGPVSGTKNVGGLVGVSRETITSSFWDIEASGLDTSAGGIGLTTLEMMDINTYLNAGWDFIDETTNGEEDLWYMPIGDYPHLVWELTETAD